MHIATARQMWVSNPETIYTATAQQNSTANRIPTTQLAIDILTELTELLVDKCLQALHRRVRVYLDRMLLQGLRELGI